MGSAMATLYLQRAAHGLCDCFRPLHDLRGSLPLAGQGGLLAGPLYGPHPRLSPTRHHSVTVGNKSAKFMKTILTSTEASSRLLSTEEVARPPCITAQAGASLI